VRCMRAVKWFVFFLFVDSLAPKRKDPSVRLLPEVVAVCQSVGSPTTPGGTVVLQDDAQVITGPAVITLVLAYI
jgi:hypothetical protein